MSSVKFSPNDSVAVRVKKLTQLVTDVAIGTTWAGLSGKPSTFPPEAHTQAASTISDSTTTGRAVLTAADAAAARTAIGAGTSSFDGTYSSLTGKPSTFPPTIGSGAADAVAGNDARLTDARTPTAHTQAASTISDSTATGRAVLTAVDAAAARSAIGAGTSSFDGTYSSLTGKPTLGTAAATNATAYATAAQGATADAAQPGDPQLTALAGLAYTGNALKVIRVNAGESGFELATPSAGAGASATTVEQNLGATPAWRGKFTITDAAISASSKVMCWQAPGPYTGKGTRADEAEMQPVQVIAVNPGSGSAVVHWQTPPQFAMALQAHDGQRLNAAGATFDRLVNQQAPEVRVPCRIGRVRGNVKFSYVVFS